MEINRKDHLPTALPTAEQLRFQDWEFGLFLHFGLRTFHEGHRDFDGKPMDPARFNPTELSCEQWIATAKAAGMRYAVLTAKHHDGFANWPSRYTDYSVASSPWQGGHGDVVREFTEACHRHGLGVGLYYSPADAASPVYSDEKAYDDYFINQLSELLSEYGKVDILWLDGCGSEGHEYDWARIGLEVARLQPGVLGGTGDPAFRYPLNEQGIAPIRCWNTVEAGDGRREWVVTECDCRMRLANWFYSDQDEDTIKRLEELMGLYYYSVGRGCNLLLNIGPDRRGLLPDRDAARRLEFGAEIRRRFAHPIVSRADWRRVEDGWETSSAKRSLLNHIILQEDLTNGEHVRRFDIQVVLDNDAMTLYEGDSIGHKAICRFPPIIAGDLRVRLLEADGPVCLRRLDAYYVPEVGGD